MQNKFYFPINSQSSKKYYFIHRFINSFWDEIKIIWNDKLPNIQKIESQMLWSNRNLRPNCGNRLSKGNQIIWNEKLLKLKEIYEMMIALDKNRPNCKQILANKYCWYLSPLDSSIKDSIDESLALSWAEKSFSQHFIEQKFKYYSNNFEKSNNQEMKNKNSLLQNFLNHYKT
jgi:hypothetical protein